MNGMFGRRVRAWLLGATVLAPASTGASAQVTLDQLRTRSAPTPPPALAQAAPARPLAPGPTERIPEGTEVRVQLDEPLSSATASTGDTFTISTDEEIRLADGVVIPAGYRGKGEVTEAHRKEMLGKAGELNIRLDYVRIGDVRVHLRANKGQEGKNTVTTTIVLTVLLTPLFLMHHGHEVVFPKGQPITAYVDEDMDVPAPIAAPPRED